MRISWALNRLAPPTFCLIQPFHKLLRLDYSDDHSRVSVLASAPSSVGLPIQNHFVQFFLLSRTSLRRTKVNGGGAFRDLHVNADLGQQGFVLTGSIFVLLSSLRSRPADGSTEILRAGRSPLCLRSQKFLSSVRKGDAPLESPAP